MLDKLYRIYHPAVFQGVRQKKGYFEGWYFKFVSEDRHESIAIIPGIAYSDQSHSFIQVNQGSTHRSAYQRFESAEFQAASRDLKIQIAGNEFSEQGIKIDLKNPIISLQGEVFFKDLHPIQTHLFYPGIMGWFSFLPFMECYHGLVSMQHQVEGELIMNGERIKLGKGKGYIEKDWGRSFPSDWIWIQSNHFEQEDVSFMLSVARIPWLGHYFTGFLGFLKQGKETFIIATYTGARIKELDYQGEKVQIKIQNGIDQIVVSAHMKEGGELQAPVQGKMERRIKESVVSTVHVEWKSNSGTVYSGEGMNAGLEVVGDLQNLINGL